jgi:hypothetical protein
MKLVLSRMTRDFLINWHTAADRSCLRIYVKCIVATLLDTRMLSSVHLESNA